MNQLGLTLTDPALALLLRRGSQTCATCQFDDYLARRPGEGTGRFPKAGPVRPIRRCWAAARAGEQESAASA